MMFRAKRRKAEEGRAFLARLARDVRANTLAMMAAMLVPMIALAGSAVDISRSYMVKVRLQQACDAGALATRKAMDTVTISQTALDEGNKLFSANFTNGIFQSSNTAFTPQATNDGQITATATTRVPMTLMKFFGMDHVDLNVSCDARLEISNTDVILVLDVTGSMADCPDDSTCNGNADSKIAALRQAVLDFFNTVNAATTSTSRFRIGFVPYSSATNVGDLLQSSWLVNSWTYQSRIANMTTPQYSRTQQGSPTVTTETYADSISSTECNRYGSNASYPTRDGSEVSSGTEPGTITVTDYAYRDWGASGTSDTSGNTRTCRRTKTVTTYNSVVTGYGFTSWTYQPVSYSVTNFVAGNTVYVYTGRNPPTGTVPTSGSYDMVQLVNTSGSTVTGTATTWDRCIEERDTTATNTSPYFDPASLDMDINTTPSGTASQWRPMWPEVEYDRGGTAVESDVSTKRSPLTGSTYCPAASKKLATMNVGDVQTFVDSLSPVGSTYHDYGMSWGVRLLSPHGLFATENQSAPNGKPISRHIIFMTDGIMQTSSTVYGAHGYEKLDKRVSGGSSSPNLDSRHNARFLALCDAARTENITVWTVAFGTSNPSTLQSCANDTGKAYVATDSAQLRSKFQQIASQISDLRLSR